MIVNLATDEGMIVAIKFMADNKIKTIKGHRTLTGMGLKESKDAVDRFVREVPRSWDVHFRIYDEQQWHHIELTEKVSAPDQVCANVIIRDKYAPHKVLVDNGNGYFI